MENLKIREFKLEEDKEELEKVQERSLRTLKNYTSEQINNLLSGDINKWKALSRSYSFVVEIPNNGIIWFWNISYKGEIKILYIDPYYFSKWIWKKLLTRLEQEATKTLNLDKMIVYSSLDAKEFYKKCGFDPIEERYKTIWEIDFKTYYMEKRLN